ncbi:uncharacterized protein SCDLUD_000663 [Saccharomycodes ludwigii]|uniref:uncharacterized protein n=1 Tax=Saccharomycodes ludwigii TaxID=36035 RepID=UPI001E873181|nr:hypothetical protein SCDLUD_000663 [Saccharomycodes ludwigii]KAH3903052.1 hypothetical protein SCDLUD_000663 [Saccharomycodes ludwigii]
MSSAGSFRIDTPNGNGYGAVSSQLGIKNTTFKTEPNVYFSGNVIANESADDNINAINMSYQQQFNRNNYLIRPLATSAYNNGFFFKTTPQNMATINSDTTAYNGNYATPITTDSPIIGLKNNYVAKPISKLIKTKKSPRKRLVWKLNQDLILLKLVIENKDLLNNPKYNKHRKSFWDYIADLLISNHNINRNTRQCRERFKLLFTKSIKNIHNNIKPKDVLDEVCLSLHTYFRMNSDNNIFLLKHEHVQDGQDDNIIINKANCQLPDNGDVGCDGAIPLESLDSVVQQKNFFEKKISSLKTEIKHLNGIVNELKELVNDQQKTISMLITNNRQILGVDYPTNNNNNDNNNDNNNNNNNDNNNDNDNDNDSANDDDEDDGEEDNDDNTNNNSSNSNSISNSSSTSSSNTRNNSTGNYYGDNCNNNNKLTYTKAADVINNVNYNKYNNYINNMNFKENFLAQPEQYDKNLYRGYICYPPFTPGYKAANVNMNILNNINHNQGQYNNIKSYGVLACPVNSNDVNLHNTAVNNNNNNNNNITSNNNNMYPTSFLSSPNNNGNISNVNQNIKLNGNNANFGTQQGPKDLLYEHFYRRGP